MSSRNVEVVQGMYEAFAQGDVPALMAAMHPQIEWNEAEGFPYADRNPYVGPQAVVDGVFARIDRDWEYWEVETTAFHDAGDTVVVEGRYRGKNRRTGSIVDIPLAHVWTLADGKATAFQQYTDTARVREAMAGA